MNEKTDEESKEKNAIFTRLIKRLTELRSDEEVEKSLREARGIKCAAKIVGESEKLITLVNTTEKFLIVNVHGDYNDKHVEIWPRALVKLRPFSETAEPKFNRF